MPRKYIRKPRKSIQKRFEDKFSVDPDSGCWLWTASINSAGYGTFSIGSRKSIGAHRASWMIYNGNLPDNLYVLHRCDTRRCVNPDHLFIGSNSDNMQDCSQKGRIFRPQGICHPRHKLTCSQVMSIRSDKRIHREIAIDYGMSVSAINQIMNHKTWVHLE